jgi:hypothetical protein
MPSVRGCYWLFRVQPVREQVRPSCSSRNFCLAFFEKHPAKWPPDERELAYEFVTYFGLPPLPQLKDYTELATRLAIEVAIAPLPEGLKGYNSHYQGRKQIVIERLQGPAEHIGIAEHTFLHELRELIEYELRREGRPSASGAELEERAETFAIAVRALAPVPFFTELGGTLLQGKGAWKYLGVGLIVGFGLFHALTCILVPHHEDYFRRLR